VGGCRWSKHRGRGDVPDEAMNASARCPEIGGGHVAAAPGACGSVQVRGGVHMAIGVGATRCRLADGYCVIDVSTHASASTLTGQYGPGAAPQHPGPRLARSPGEGYPGEHRWGPGDEGLTQRRNDATEEWPVRGSIDVASWRRCVRSCSEGLSPRGVAAAESADFIHPSRSRHA
jgi:hypothetical protein